jgi:hypothetical protein|tara:strand:+ start:1253 stop:2161 length:909 start_codon:yes stop_codon:yes gene_type:complete
MKKFSQFLTEKLILISNGKKYGQIVFLVGGSGSGKGFALANFMEKEKFKIRDVDEWKSQLQRMARIKDDPVKWAELKAKGHRVSSEKYKEIKDLDLTKPADVFKFHKYVEKLDIKSKTLDMMLRDTQGKEKGTLPNIMFDITAKVINDIAKFMPQILKAGYDPANIHIVWVLTNYTLALSNNLDPKRGRIVPEDIMLWTHKGAAQTMFDYIQGKGKKLAINGAIHVILNNRENTIYWENDKGEEIDVIKDFKYLTLKKRGKGMMKEKSIQRQLYQWIVDNIPTGDLLKGLIDRGVKQGRSRK